MEPPFFLRGSRMQIILVSLVAFSTVGMFNAIVGLGGAGSTDPTTANNSNTALYVTFAIFGYFGGVMFNLLGKYGNRILVGCGGFTYGLYAVGQYVAGHNDGFDWLAILSGTILGIGAAMFATAQGAMMLAYAPEDKKGTYISLFWVISCLGGFVGGILVFAVNFENESPGASSATYFTLAAIMTVGAISSFFILCSPDQVIREDGVAVKVQQQTGPIDEIRNVALMFLDRHMLLLTPLFLASNFFYTYEFNVVNGALFSIRARGLNVALYWGAQMMGSFVFGRLFLDSAKYGRRHRAIYGGIVLGGIYTVTWALCCYLQIGWEGGFSKATHADFVRIDIDDSVRYIYPICVFLMFGLSDSMLQTYAYWLMGAITNDLNQLARYAGYYKGIQSAGAAVAWQLDNVATWKVEMFFNWALFTISIPPALAVAYFWVYDNKEDTEIECNLTGYYGSYPYVDQESAATCINSGPVGEVEDKRRKIAASP
eukprot:comp21356_c0_seq1/m.29321 comp21356_c0_seq1/g.29321  ORF comp21356_c0_seq1/g.29321 comp21356_c0_seq1/m.29321 type:complete len:485 (-) comp21356_c0_seq1:403-1857(-)